MNTDCVHIYGIVIKLTYSFPKKEQPQLEIFPDNDLTRNEEWSIYGAQFDEEGNERECVRIVNFNDPSESKTVEIGSKFRIQFLDFRNVEVDYPRGGKTMETAYYFEIEALK